MKLLVGLGNPGSKHARQRHNVGFLAVDAIHDAHDFGPWREKWRGLIAEGFLDGEKTLLLKPQTFMNESGRSVAEPVKFYKLAPADVAVLYDELDLAPGKVRVKTGGGAGGHNGIRSIDQHMPKDYRRVRIGIGHPGHKDRVTGHVLGDFAAADHEWLDPLLAEIARNAPLLAKGDDAAFMNRLALRTASDEPPGAKGQSSAKKKSHIRQARQSGPSVKVPEKGPMAEMLRKLLGK